jgi:hypothetical protein
MTACYGEENEKECYDSAVEALIDEVLPSSSIQSDTMIELANTVKYQGECMKKLSDKVENLCCDVSKYTINELKDRSITFNSIFRLIFEKALIPILFAALTYFIMKTFN